MEKNLTYFGYTLEEIKTRNHLDDFRNNILSFKEYNKPDESGKQTELFKAINKFFKLSTDNSIFEISQPHSSWSRQCDIPNSKLNPKVLIPLEDIEHFIDLKMTVSASSYDKSFVLKIFSYKGLLLLADDLTLYGCINTLRQVAIMKTNDSIINKNDICFEKLNFNNHIVPIVHEEFHSSLKNLYEELACVGEIISDTEKRQKLWKKRCIDILFSIIPNNKLIEFQEYGIIKAAQISQYNHPDRSMSTFNFSKIKIYFKNGKEVEIWDQEGYITISNINLEILIDIMK